MSKKKSRKDLKAAIKSMQQPSKISDQVDSDLPEMRVLLHNIHQAILKSNKSTEKTNDLMWGVAALACALTLATIQLPTAYENSSGLNTLLIVIRVISALTIISTVLFLVVKYVKK